MNNNIRRRHFVTVEASGMVVTILDDSNNSISDASCDEI